MDADSEGERENHNRSGKSAAGNSNDGQSKPKRQMKTPFQLEALEKAYALEKYPSEAMRAELSQRLNLTDRQLQMWFCHRRLKDKKETPNKKPSKPLPSMEPEPPAEKMKSVEPEPGSEYGSGSRSGSGSGTSPFTDARKMSLDDMQMAKRYYEPSPQSIMELRAIACVEAQLGEPLREDGPVLGMEFDALPPDAFGAPIAMAEQLKRSAHVYDGKPHERHEGKSSKRSFHEYQSLQDHSNKRSGLFNQALQSPYHESSFENLRQRPSFHHEDESLGRVHGVQGQTSRASVLSRGHNFSSPHADDDSHLHHDSFTSNRNVESSSHPHLGSENPDIFPDAPIFHADADVRLEKKRKIDETKLSRETEAQELRSRKELEKQDQLRRKNEERMRKEMERLDRERRKEEERLMRERQREEERSVREQKRELERREKFLQKEYIRAEKMRQKEELRREKEAVRRQAAIEKAATRRIAKESLGLLEDEQLELMELAALSAGSSSIVNLSYDTLQNLDSFRGSLRMFPPESVQLKKLFAFQPWMDSEENIGNLLMVWRFFITFADVLGLWPFTLDEFVQAFHDYDSRLLGEIHISVLKLIIKDIEDVARTPSTGLGTNQYCTANPEGGHPQIVEGAYMWGFDICNWQRHLNPLTWPEIFRQLAISAGFGPRLRKRSSTWRHSGDKDEVKGCENTISTLRNGSAAENAFALMRERGLLLPRRSRHRLTPGTVKFAAFHVLSLEGSKGLTVTELAEKIQKSGLRDLTTSRTPEASISVALNRDQKLFERIAPSTYCVRDAYRKDPADAEAILSSARKKIRAFENGFLGGEDADDVERDEDFEGDVDEDPEIDNLVAPLGANISADHCNEENTFISGKNRCNGIPPVEPDKLPSFVPSDCPKDAKPTIPIEKCVAPEVVGANDVGQENMEIDESDSGESWVQGLAEGEYALLSVEERLNALVALVGVANEGNTIRAVLEDRLEAANALKKQMWAEAQLDRSRLKEDIMSKLEFPSSVIATSSVKGSQSPIPFADSKMKEASPSTNEDRKELLATENGQNHLNSAPTEKFVTFQDPFNTSERSRSQLKAFIGHLAEETYVYRSLPLGQDRRRNRYWQFVASASRNDPCSGRIFVELHGGNWRIIDTEEAFDALVSSLDTRGVWESHLRLMLQKIEKCFKSSVQSIFQSGKTVDHNWTTTEKEAVQAETSSDCSAGSGSPNSVVCGPNRDTLDSFSSFSVELGRNVTEKKNALRRYQELQKWMWKECFNTSTLCSMKHGKQRCVPVLDTCNPGFNLSTTSSNTSEHDRWIAEPEVLNSSLPLGIRLLKALLALIEVYVPPEALESFWLEDLRKTWASKLNNSSSTEELLQILTVLESAIRRDCLSANFEMTKELLGSSSSSQSALFGYPDLDSVHVLPWIPKTTAAVALRLFDLDASTAYIKPEKAEPIEDTPVKLNMKLLSRYSPLNNDDVELRGINDQSVKTEYLNDIPSKRGRGTRRGQGQAAKSQRRVSSNKSGVNRRNVREIEKFNFEPKHQVQKPTTARGRRTVRKRRTDVGVNDHKLAGHMGNTVIYSRSFQSLNEEDWGGGETALELNGFANSNSAEAESEDDNAEAEQYEPENWEKMYSGATSGWNVDSEEGIETMEVEESGSDEEGNGMEIEVDSDSGDSDDYSDRVNM